VAGGVPWSAEFWCDSGTIVSVGLQNGSTDFPFALLGQAYAAVNALPKGTIAAIQLAAGTYDASVAGNVPNGYQLSIVAQSGAIISGDSGPLAVAADPDNACLCSFVGVEIDATISVTGSADSQCTLNFQECSVPFIDGSGMTGQIRLVLNDGSHWSVATALTAPTAAVEMTNGVTASGIITCDTMMVDAAVIFAVNLACATATIMRSPVGAGSGISLDCSSALSMDAFSLASATANLAIYPTELPVLLPVAGGVPPTSTNIQTVAATLTSRVAGTLGLCTQPNFPVTMRFTSTSPAAVGESMTIDVRKLHSDGTSSSLLTAPFVFNNASAGRTFSLTLVTTQAARALIAGDGVEVVRTYVPGGTPTMTTTSVDVQSAL